MATGVKGNIFRRNLVVGNPGVQVSVDHSSSNGFDIQSLANSGDNAFEGNTCVTSMNAPCPSVGPSLTANPNPIPIPSGVVGQTTISWSAPDAQVIEIHIGKPDGQLFAIQGNRGSAQTGVWVSEGLTFYLQDVTDGRPLTSDYTLAILVMHLQNTATNGGVGWEWRPSGRQGGAAALLLGLWVLLACRQPRRRMAGGLAGVILLVPLMFLLPPTRAQTRPSVQERSAKLNEMLSAHKSQEEVARYVFDTYGCRGCHTTGQDGKLGFTSRGQEAGQNFEGCVRMLTEMNGIVSVPDQRRSAQQRQRAARFQDFGCTFCHQAAGGKLGLTQVGAKLTNAHIGCVDVEKVIASASPKPRQ